MTSFVHFLLKNSGLDCVASVYITLHVFQNNWQSMLCFWEFACGQSETVSMEKKELYYKQEQMVCDNL